MIPVAVPMVKFPLLSVVVVNLLEESCTVMVTPDRVLPEAFFTVPEALQVAKEQVQPRAINRVTRARRRVRG
jgi:hypothetical protein